MAGDRRQGGEGAGRTTVLLVPGFVVDVFSEIEASFVELSEAKQGEIGFVWLVPDLRRPHYSTSTSKTCRMAEPLYVSRLREKRIPFVVGSVSRYNFLANFLLFRRIFRERPIDVVFTHFGHERFWAAFFAKLWRKKVVWNEHWHSLGTRYVWPKRLFYRLFVDAFVAVSGFIGRTLPKTARVATIPNAILPDTRAPLSPDERRRQRVRLGLAADRAIVLMVAAFRAEKRHDLALRICERVWEQRPDVHFVFLGEGPLRPAFVDLARRCGTNRISAPGHSHEVNDHYRVADLSMLTSRDEPFGYCVLEAMNFGVPCVAFRSGGPAEILEHDRTGFLVEEGDLDGFARQLVELLADEAKRQAVARRAREAARRYHRSEWIERIADVLEGAGRHPGGPVDVLRADGGARNGGSVA